LEWGIINGNLPDMDSILIRNMINESAYRLTEESYPNPDLGFGLIE